MESSNSTGILNTRRIVIAGVLIAVSAVLAYTGLGYFPVPNVTAEATIMHVPAIIGGVLEGGVVGTVVGLVFAVNSFIRFSGLPFFVDQPAWMPFVVLFLPRLFIGPAAWLGYRSLKRVNEIAAIAVGASTGTLTNSALVLGLAIGLGLLPPAVIAASLPQIVFEVIVAAVVTVAVVAGWKQIERGRGGSSV